MGDAETIPNPEAVCEEQIPNPLARCPDIYEALGKVIASLEAVNKAVKEVRAAMVPKAPPKSGKGDKSL